MGADNTPAVKSGDNLTMFQSKDAQLSLPKHSYWFDFWAFLLFDIVFFLFMYFIVP